MTKDDLSALREVAEKATQEEWTLVMCDDQRPMVCTAGDVICLPDPNHGVDGGLPDIMDVNNFAYIAAFNPQTVLALLDHLAAEKARADAAERERDHFRTFAKEATAKMTNYAGGGSELFHSERYGLFLADIEVCIEQCRRQQETQHNVLVRECEKRKAAEARSTALEAERDAAKARADEAEEECRKARIAMNGAIRANAENKATIADLTAKLQMAEALAKEESEARDHWFDLATYEVGGVPQHWKDRAERAETTIASLTEQLAEAREALKPFAKYASLPSFDKLPVNFPVTIGSPLAAQQITVDHFRRAASALSRLEKQEGEA